MVPKRKKTQNARPLIQKLSWIKHTEKHPKYLLTQKNAVIIHAQQKVTKKDVDRRQTR